MIGILYAYCCGYARNIVVISILCGIAPLLFASIMTFMPESPLFYMAKENEEAAKKSMRFFRGSEYNIDPEISAFKVSVTLATNTEVFARFLRCSQAIRKLCSLPVWTLCEQRNIQQARNTFCSRNSTVELHLLERNFSYYKL